MSRDAATRSDVTQQQERVSAQLALAMLRASSDGIVLLDAHGTVTFASEAAERMLGYFDSRALGRNALELVHPDDRVSALEGLESTTTSTDSRPLPLLLRLQRADGSWVHTEVIGTNHLGDPNIHGIVLNIRDVSRSMRTDEALRVSEEHHRLIVELARDGIWAVDAAGRTTFANRAMASMLDTTVPQLLGASVFQFLDASTDRDVLHALSGHNLRTRRERDLRLTTRRGRIVWTRVNTSPITDHAGAFQGAVATVTDITDLRTLEMDLEIALRRDPLTGAANRLELFEVLSASLTAGGPVTCLYIDLDGFKSVNDRHGHAVGDELLQEVVIRLRDTVRSDDLVARVGGDEFVVVTRLLDVNAAVSLGRRICDALQAPFVAQAAVIRLSASTGIAISSGGNPDDLLHNADTALYRAKQHGRNRVELAETSAGAGTTVPLRRDISPPVDEAHREG